MNETNFQSEREQKFPSRGRPNGGGLSSSFTNSGNYREQKMDKRKEEEVNTNKDLIKDSEQGTMSTIYSKDHYIEYKKGYPDELGRIDPPQLAYVWQRADTAITLDFAKATLDFFFERYFNHCDKKHPRLVNSKIKDTMERMKYCPNRAHTFPIEFTVDEYKTMIDYFENQQAFKGNAQGKDPLIFQFMRDRVRERCYFEACKRKTPKL